MNLELQIDHVFKDYGGLIASQIRENQTKIK